ncbi:MAG: glycosyltransferase family 4 protein [Nitrospirales bacterium]|nr:glycosyltransferase family 4 protein [Nitrospirales bacterium]
MELLIVTSTPHYKVGDCLYSYGPYTREIDIWADLFENVLIAAPLRYQAPTADCIPFTSNNISLVPQMETGGMHYRDKILQILALPIHFWNLSVAMSKVDAIHVRCPGNFGLLGAILAPLFSRYCIAKYAGQWNGFRSEPISVRMQRFILRSWWWRNGLVTVYGEWPRQPRQVIPFFTSMMTAEQVQHGALVSRDKRLTLPAEILYAGRLVPCKGVDILLRSLKILFNQGLAFKLSIVGDGPERNHLLKLTQELGLTGHVHFVGAVPYNEVMSWYEKSHILVLPSFHSEGWPKVLAEAMCYGLVCVGTDHGLVPWLLQNRGVVVPVADVEGLATGLRGILEDASVYDTLSKQASSWAQGYSLEKLKESLGNLMASYWEYRLIGKSQV